MPENDPSSPGLSVLSDPFFWVQQTHFRVACRIRGLWITLRLRAIGGHVGKGLRADRGVRIVTARGARWHIGDGVSLGSGMIISVTRGARLHLADAVRFGHFVIIGAEESIEFMPGSGAAEYSSIRDSDHDMTAPSMRWGGLTTTPVHIGADVWIGRGVAVLRGSTIGAGAVIGANAVVRGEIPAHAVAVGMPARVCHFRPAPPTAEPAEAVPPEADPPEAGTASEWARRMLAAPRTKSLHDDDTPAPDRPVTPHQ